MSQPRLHRAALFRMAPRTRMDSSPALVSHPSAHRDGMLRCIHPARALAGAPAFLLEPFSRACRPAELELELELARVPVCTHTPASCQLPSLLSMLSAFPLATLRSRGRVVHTHPPSSVSLAIPTCHPLSSLPLSRRRAAAPFQELAPSAVRPSAGPGSATARDIAFERPRERRACAFTDGAYLSAYVICESPSQCPFLPCTRGPMYCTSLAAAKSSHSAERGVRLSTARPRVGTDGVAR